VLTLLLVGCRAAGAATGPGYHVMGVTCQLVRARSRVVDKTTGESKCSSGLPNMEQVRVTSGVFEVYVKSRECK